MTTPPAPTQPAHDADTPAMQRLRAEIARMSPERFAACWQKGITLAALSLAQQERGAGEGTDSAAQGRHRSGRGARNRF
jgi:hypothetical protein